MIHEGQQLVEPHEIFKNAAIVVLIYQTKTEKEIVFIKRNEYDGHHSGQVGFPGGKEDEDDESLLHTAIRECYEEIGVKLTEKELIGILSPVYVMISEFMVYPYVFYLSSEPVFSIDKSEVQYLIPFPLKKLVGNSLRQEKNMNFQGENHIIPYYDIKDEIVWGATAMILSEFIEIVKKMH